MGDPATLFDLEPETDLETVRDAASQCRACPLWKHATQTVFGEGPDDAPLMLVGE
jgi:uracil-DNA glycosylase